MIQPERKDSSLVTWLKSLPRWSKDIDIAPMKNHDGAPVQTVRFMINRKAEEDEAIECAYAETDRRAKSFAEGAVDAIKNDTEYVTDFKTVQALWRACKDPNDPLYSVFPTAQWMKDNLTGHELAYLLNHYNACKFEAAGIPMNMDKDRIEAYRDGCVATFSTPVPDEALQMLPRDVLSTLTVLTMKYWHDERETLIARIIELEAKLPAETIED